MASVDWQKMTRQKAAALVKHNGKKERLQYNHSNEDIDKSKSELNFFIGADDYCDMYEAMIARVDEVDTLYPQLRKIDPKTRPICESIECKCPKAIYDMGYEKAREFFFGVHKIMQEYFGKENVHGACVHFDEVHEYYDPKTKENRVSLAHSTELVSCYVEWQENITKNIKQENGKYKKIPTGETRERKGINGKNFETKVRYAELNKLVDDFCINTFGVGYMTGELTTKNKSVEFLKIESEKAEKQAELDALNEQLDAQQRLLIKGIEPFPERKELPEEFKNEPLGAEGCVNYDIRGQKKAEKNLEKWNKRKEKAEAAIEKEYERDVANWREKNMTAVNLKKAVEHNDKIAAEQAQTAKKLNEKAQELAIRTADLERREKNFKRIVDNKVKKEISENEKAVEQAERRTIAMKARTTYSKAYKKKYSLIFNNSEQKERNERNVYKSLDGKPHRGNTAGKKQIERE